MAVVVVDGGVCVCVLGGGGGGGTVASCGSLPSTLQLLTQVHKMHRSGKIAVTILSRLKLTAGKGITTITLLEDSTHPRTLKLHALSMAAS